jgi:hypothetical protein
LASILLYAWLEERPLSEVLSTNTAGRITPRYLEKAYVVYVTEKMRAIAARKTP